VRPPASFPALSPVGVPTRVPALPAAVRYGLAVRTNRSTRQLAKRLRERAGRAVLGPAETPQPQASQPGATRPKAPRTAILVVDGFDRRGRWGAFNEEEAREFPWVDLCLRQIARHSRSSDYEVLVWDNTWMPEHKELVEQHPKVRRFEPRDPGRDLRHGQSLDRLVKKVRPGTEFVITLDTDSFPIRDGWIENLTGRLTDDVLLAGVWRDEMLPKKPAFVHPSCLAVRKRTLADLEVGFAIGGGNDVAATITSAVLERGSRTSRLHRSNRWQPHFLMGAIYGDLVYHQGAGSRAPMFSQESDADHDETVRLALRDLAFSDLDGMLDVLAGNAEPSSVQRLAALGQE
jgi:hypothetical protein